MLLLLLLRRARLIIGHIAIVAFGHYIRRTVIQARGVPYRIQRTVTAVHIRWDNELAEFTICTLHTVQQLCWQK